MAGITDQGLEIKRLNQIRESLQQGANEIFADLIPEGDLLDTSSASTIGRLIGITTPSEVDLWEAIQQVYLAFDPNSASGIPLDNLVALSGIVRKGATASTARVLLSGNYNVTIPDGSLVSSSFTSTRFEIPSQVILNENNVVGIVLGVQSVANSTLYTATYNDGINSINFNYTSSGSATTNEILTGLRDEINNNLGSIVTATVVGETLEVNIDDQVSTISWSISGNLFFSGSVKGITVIATEVGPKEQPVGTIDTITTPIFGWNSVTQIAAAIVGSNKETDSELRARFNESKFARGSNLVESLFSDLIGLSGVNKAVVYENDSSSVDSNGLPAHSFMALVEGGLEEEIAYTIWRNKPAGITTFGNTTFTIKDIQGSNKDVKFQRPVFVDVYISISITALSDFPPNGEEKIKSALFQYFQDNQSIGDNVIYSRLYTPINSVVGHQVDDLQISTTSPATGTSNIAIDFDEIAKLEIGNIEVTVT